MTLQKTVSKILNKNVSEQEAQIFASENFGILASYLRENPITKKLRTECSYAVIKFNSPEMERENVLGKNKYKKTKFAMLLKSIHKDSSESITFIDYSNDIVDLQNRASQFESWYNYPLGLFKDRNQTIKKLA